MFMVLKLCTSILLSPPWCWFIQLDGFILNILTHLNTDIQPFCTSFNIKKDISVTIIADIIFIGFQLHKILKRKMNFAIQLMQVCKKKERQAGAEL